MSDTADWTQLKEVISELKDDPAEIAQDVVKTAKEIEEQKAGSERQEGPQNSILNPKGRREDRRESKRNVLQGGASTSCSNKGDFVSDSPSRFQGGESLKSWKDKK